ncbi:MAG: cupin domain-containing protein [Pelagimonas sp.]|uniref:cupin domain-containing protein n=1 Tax=Pelagimonas sp. TaxID=2073170 RepID=UPI003D6B1C50
MSVSEDNNRYLVTAAEIASEKGLSKKHFLNPNAQRINKSLGDLTGLTGFGFHIIEVEPGRDTTEHHVHHHEDECVYVLEGNATALIGNEAIQIGPGDFLGYRRGGFAHSIRNTGSKTLRCIVVGERLAHDVGDYPNKGKRIFRNIGLPWNLVDHHALEEPQAGAKK